MEFNLIVVQFNHEFNGLQHLDAYVFCVYFYLCMCIDVCGPV